MSRSMDEEDGEFAEVAATRTFNRGAGNVSAKLGAEPLPSEIKIVEAPIVLPAWRSMRVAIIDDAMHPPRLDRLSQEEADVIAKMLSENIEVIADLDKINCPANATPDEKLLLLAESRELLVSFAIIGGSSISASLHFEEHRTFRRLVDLLRTEVQSVTVCDPYQQLPDLSSENLILLDYYLNGPTGGGDAAVEAATTIRGQADRPKDQQIVLMSSLETVRELRGAFRTATNLSGSAFAFVGKPDLNEAWKIKAHLGMLERARPYGTALIDYREELERALTESRTDLLKLVDDLDIGDYAFLQSRALMNDGHPLGDYVFWLLSSQLMAFAFERDEMRHRQRALDELEFVGAPFAATEPSTVVANLLHSALVSRNVGPLGPHPRAKPESKYHEFPLVHLGDVFLDADRTKAVVVMSAACDLAFSPMKEREPDADTPVMIVPGRPVKLKDAKDDGEAKTDGILHLEEVYRIVWDFGKYRSVPLGQLGKWLQDENYYLSNRDRLRPLFALKLQQEFGAHLMRVGPPVLPPMTTGAAGKIFVCAAEIFEGDRFAPTELMLTRFRKITLLRVTPPIAGALKRRCEELVERMSQLREEEKDDKKKANWTSKINSITECLRNDEFWIKLLEGVELNAPGTIKQVGPLNFIIGREWSETKNRVVLQIDENVTEKNDVDAKADDGFADVQAGAVSSAA